MKVRAVAARPFSGPRLLWLLLSLPLFAGGALVARAQGPGGASYYEQWGPYCFGSGGVSAGDPVDVATGSYLVREKLAVIPGRMPMSLSWQFQSQDASDGPLGMGTSLSSDWFLMTHSGGYYEMLGPGNIHYVFNQTEGYSDYFNSNDAAVLGARLTMNNDGVDLSATLRWKEGTRFLFDANGGLTRIEDRHGNYLTITRNASGYTTAITQPGGRAITLAYGLNGKLATVTLPVNRTWQFAYDASSRLTQVTDPASRTSGFTWTAYQRGYYGELPLVQTVIDRTGRTRLTNVYDASGRVTAQTAADGGVTTFDYWGGGTTVTDPRGNTATWAYAWTGGAYGYDLTGTTDALGRATAYERVPGTRLLAAAVDFRGRRVEFNWDTQRGNLLSVTTPTAGGGTQTWSNTYEPTYCKLTAATDPLNRQTVVTVDPTTGNTTAVRNARNQTTQFGYAANGDLLWAKNPLNQTVSFGYSTEGDLATVTDPLSRQTVFTRDGASRVTMVRDANNRAVTVSHSPMDLVTSVTRTLGGSPVTTTYQYDVEGNRRFLTDPANQAWEWVYDSMDRVVQEKDPLGRSAFYTWDRNSNILTWTDRRGCKGEYAYGTADRPTTITYRKADGSVEATVTPAYNATTHLVQSVTDSAFGTTSWGRDALDRVVEETGPHGTLTWTLDDVGRRTSLQVPGQGLITYGFDNVDNLTSITQNGLASSFVYDSLNRPVRRDLPNGVSTEWAFNEVGFLASVTAKRGGVPFDSRASTRDAVGLLTQENVNGDVRTYWYDDLYRLTSATVGGVASSWSYDIAGNRTSKTVGGQTTSYVYAAGNRLTQAGGQPVTHDYEGNLTAYGGDAYTWDARGRLAGMSRPGLSVSHQYDPSGLRTGKTVNGTTTNYLLDGDSIVAELTGGTNVPTLQGPLTDQPLQRNGQYLTQDGLSSTTTLTDAAGTVTQSYGYSPFGESSQSTAVANPLQYTGRENDGLRAAVQPVPLTAGPSGFGSGQEVPMSTMRLETAATSSDAQPAVLQRVTAYLRSQDYQSVETGASLRFRRGSSLGSLTSFSPRRWGVEVTLQPQPEGGAVRYRILFEINTTGQTVNDSERHFWQQEQEGLVSAAEGRTAPTTQAAEAAVLRTGQDVMKQSLLYALIVGGTFVLAAIVLRPLGVEITPGLAGVGAGIGAAFGARKASEAAKRDDSGPDGSP